MSLFLIYNVAKFLLFIDKLQDLLCYGLHAPYRGMIEFFVNILELDIGNAVMAADHLSRFYNFFSQLAINDEYDFDVGVPLLGLLAQVSQCRTIGKEVGLSKIIILIIAQFCSRPVIVGAAKDENHIRAAKAWQSGDKRPAAIVLVIVSMVADCGTAVGVVLLNEAARLIDDLPPPGLGHVVNISS